MLAIQNNASGGIVVFFSRLAKPVVSRLRISDLVATAVTLAATYPIDALRTRNYAGEELAFVRSGWYRGYGFAVAGGALHRGVYVFGSKLFEKLDKRLAPRLAASVARLFSYPAATIRRRLQLDDARKYHGALDCLVVTCSLASLLLDAGASVNLMQRPPREHCFAPLHLAVRSGSLPCVRTLVRRRPGALAGDQPPEGAAARARPRLRDARDASPLSARAARGRKRRA